MLFYYHHGKSGLDLVYFANLAGDDVSEVIRVVCLDFDHNVIDSIDALNLKFDSFFDCQHLLDFCDDLLVRPQIRVQQNECNRQCRM